MIELPAIVRQSLLHQATNDYGFDTLEDMFEATILDSVSPGICHRCGYTTEVEPDSDSGWCEECHANSVVSVLMLGGII